jgi:hypothetical protein
MATGPIICRRVPRGDHPHLDLWPNVTKAAATIRISEISASSTVGHQCVGLLMWITALLLVLLKVTSAEVAFYPYNSTSTHVILLFRTTGVADHDVR